MRGRWQTVRLLRAPLAWAAVGGLAWAARAVLLPALFVWLNDRTPSSHTVYRVSDLRLDYLLFLPNVVVWLAYLLIGLVVLELKQWRHPANRTRRDDALTAVVGLLVMASSQVLMGNIKPGGAQLLLSGAQVLVLWAFLMINAGLRSVDRWAARVPAAVWTWTFPISEVIGYVRHRRQWAKAGWVRWVPTACYAAAAAGLLVWQGGILATAVRAMRLPAPVIDVNSAIPVEGGVWFADGDTWSARAGLWYYDESSRTAQPVIRTADTRRFLLEDGFFYFQDRYARAAYKVDAETREIAWTLPTQPSGTFEMVKQGSRLYIVGEGGYILIADTEGRVLAERTLPVLAFEAQAVWGDQVAFVSGDPRIRIWDGLLTRGEDIPLPLPDGIPHPPYNERNNAGLQVVTSMTAYAEQAHVFYAGTFWGEVFRYDVKARRWLPSFHTLMAVRSIAPDERNGLLFLANYFQGVIDVLDLDTGRHLGYILANGRSRYIDLDPAAQRGVLSTHGYGAYLFSYADLARRRARLRPTGLAAR